MVAIASARRVIANTPLLEREAAAALQGMVWPRPAPRVLLGFELLCAWWCALSGRRPRARW
ncbi:MAG TPA: hypothetical protein VHS99_24130 [Chloroflexota bacterium]|nr:hypothetical protein [Chloroflexota bacterium]